MQDQSFEGLFTYSLEQYGLLLQDAQSSIHFHEDTALRGRWNIVMPQFNEMDASYFHQFVKSLDDYIFNILKTAPSRQWVNGNPPEIDIFFNDVYFDLSGAKPVLKKMVPKSVDRS